MFRPLQVSKLEVSNKAQAFEIVKDFPEWLIEKYFPVLENMANRAEIEFQRACREKDLFEIRYRLGHLDALKSVLQIVPSLKKSSAQIPLMGKMSRE